MKQNKENISGIVCGPDDHNVAKEVLHRRINVLVVNGDQWKGINLKTK